MAEPTEPSRDAAMAAADAELSADDELKTAADEIVVSTKADAEIIDSTAPPDTAPPPPPVPRYDTKKVPRGDSLTAKRRIDEARLELRRLHKEETAKLLTPDALQDRLGHDNLKEFVKEALVSLKERRPIDSALMDGILTYANTPLQLEKAAKISGVEGSDTENVKITEKTLEELAARIQEWAKETIALEMEKDDRRERAVDSGKSWYKRGWVKKTGLIMAAGAGVPLIATAPFAAGVIAAGWATWSGIAAVAGIRITDAGWSMWSRGKRERKIRDAKLASMDNTATHNQLTLEALSFVSARMNENAEENPEEQALAHARSEYAANLIKGRVSETEKLTYETASNGYFATRRLKILKHLGAEEGIDLEAPEHRDLKEHVNAIMALARADERNRLVEAQVDAHVGDGKQFPGIVGKVFSAVREDFATVSKGLGVARTEYRLGYAVAMTTGAILARATDMRRVWGAAIGAMGGSALAEAAVASRLNKTSESVITNRDLGFMVSATRKVKDDALAMFSTTTAPEPVARDAMIVKVRQQVDSAEVYKKLGQKLRDKDAAKHVQNLTVEQQSLHDIMVALQSLRGVSVVPDAVELTEADAELAKDQGKLTELRKNKILAARVGGAIAGGTLGFFAPDFFKKSLAWAQDHMPGADHVPDVVPTTPAPDASPDPDVDPAKTTPMTTGGTAPVAPGTAVDPKYAPMAPGPGGAPVAPDVHAPADVAPTASGSAPSSEVLQDAVVHKSEGIQHSLIRQLIDSPKAHGYEGDPNDAAAVKEWAGHEAHLRCLDPRNAYVTQEAETRVRIPDKYAYVLNSDGTVTEYEVTPVGGGEFEAVGLSGNATTLDAYEYKVPLGTHETVHVPHADIHVDTPDADVSVEPHASVDVSSAGDAEPDRGALEALLSSLHSAQDSGDTAAVVQAQAAVADFGHDHPDSLFDATTQTTTEVGDTVQSEGIQQLNDMLDAGSGTIENPRAFHDALVNVFRTIMPDDDAQKLALTIGETDPATREVVLDAGDVSRLLKFDQSGFDVDHFTRMKDDFYAELNQHTLPSDSEWHPRHPMGLEGTGSDPDQTDKVFLVRLEPGSTGTYEVFDSSLRHTGHVDPEVLEQMLKPVEDVTPQVPVEPVVEPTETPAPAEAPETPAETVDDTEANEPTEPLPPSVSSEPIMGDTSHEKVLSASDDTSAPSADETPTADAEAPDATPTSEYADLLARPSTEIPDEIHLSIDDDAHRYMQEHNIKIDAESGKIVMREGSYGTGHEIFTMGGNAMRFEMVNGRLYAIAESNGYYFPYFVHDDALVESIGNGKVSDLHEFPEKEAAYHERESLALAHDREEAANAAIEKSAPVAPRELSAGELEIKLETTNKMLDIVQPGLSMKAILDESDPATLSAIQENLQTYIAALDSQGQMKATAIANLLRDAQSAVAKRLETLEGISLRPAA